MIFLLKYFANMKLIYIFASTSTIKHTMTKKNMGVLSFFLFKVINYQGFYSINVIFRL